MQGEGLKAIRSELGLTQAEMAQALGMTRPHYAVLETSAKQIDYGTGMLASLLLEHVQRRDVLAEALRQFDEGALHTSEARGGKMVDTTAASRETIAKDLEDTERWIVRIKAGKSAP